MVTETSKISVDPFSETSTFLRVCSPKVEDGFLNFSASRLPSFPAFGFAGLGQRLVARGKQPSGGDQDGFSIVEVMIGIAILAIGVLGLVSMQISGVRGNLTARQYTEASTLAMDKIETLITRPYTHPDLDDTDGDGVPPGDLGLFDATAASADHVENDPAGRYVIYWNVAGTDLIENTKTVSVIVLWEEGTGRWRSVSIQRVIPEII